MRPTFDHIDMESEMSAKALLQLLKSVISVCPDAMITIRQTKGTDFPPFLSIETPECHDRTDAEGEFTNLLTH